ncbi:MFS transporter [Streptomyces noursei]|uniref:MFS transporter n=1 Tax=Streptomyces noursei TaxID=1971 RepID=UPI002896DDBE
MVRGGGARDDGHGFCALARCSRAHVIANGAEAQACVRWTDLPGRSTPTGPGPRNSRSSASSGVVGSSAGRGAWPTSTNRASCGTAGRRAARRASPTAAEAYACLRAAVPGRTAAPRRPVRLGVLAGLRSLHRGRTRTPHELRRPTHRNQHHGRDRGHGRNRNRGQSRGRSTGCGTEHQQRRGRERGRWCAPARHGTDAVAAPDGGLGSDVHRRSRPADAPPAPPARRLGTLPSEMAMVFAPGFVVFILLPQHAHRVTDRLGRTPAMVVSFAASALFAIGLGLTATPVIIAVLWAVAAACFAAQLPAEQATVAADDRERIGRGMGLYESARLCGVVAGPGRMGVAYQELGWLAACSLAAGAATLGAITVPYAIRTLALPEQTKSATGTTAADTGAQLPSTPGWYAISRTRPSPSPTGPSEGRPGQARHGTPPTTTPNPQAHHRVRCSRRQLLLDIDREG